MGDILLPKGWVLAPIAQLISIDGLISDGDWVESKDQDINGSVRLIQLADVGDGYFQNKSNRFMSIEKAKALNCTFLKQGDLLIARLPAPLGRTCIFPEIGQKSVTVVDICIIRTSNNSAITNSVLTYWLNSPFMRNEIEVNSSGTTRKRITRKKLEQFVIPLPPMPEQKIIAEKLDLLLAQVQETKSRLEQIPELLKQFRQSVLSDACFCDFSTNSDKYQFWKKSSLKELTTKIGSGSTPKGGNNVYKNKGIPLVRSMNIYSNYIKYDDLAYIDDEQAKKLANVEIQPDDILLNITGASIGRVNIAPQLFVGGRVNQHVSIIRCKKQKLLPKFLQIYLASPEIQKWIVKENYGATRQALTKSMIEKLIISYPPIQEQIEIVRRVEQLFAYADKIEQQVNTALEKVNHLPQSILAKAFRGELTAQWRAENVDLITGENSAASLLEKIQVERAQNNKNKKKK